MKIASVILVGLLAIGVYGHEHKGEHKNEHQKAHSHNMEYKKVADGELLKADSSKEYCDVCGMHLRMHYKTNTAIVGEPNAQFCSFNCLYNTLFNKSYDKAKIIDAKTLKFTDIASAFYVMDSDRPATMTETSLYAFKSKDDAERFAKKYGGKIIDFKTVKQEYAKNNDQNQKRLESMREKMMYPRGKEILNEYCDAGKIKDIKAQNIAVLKASIKEQKACKNIDEKALQAVGLYAWKYLR